MPPTPHKRVKLKTNTLIKNNILTKTVVTFDVPEFQIETENTFSIPEKNFLKFHTFKTYKESMEFFNKINLININENLGFKPPAIYYSINKEGILINERMKFKSLKFLLELLIDKQINLMSNDDRDILNILSNEMVVEYLNEIFKKMETVPRVLDESRIPEELFLSILTEKKDILYLIKKLDNDYKIIIPNSDTLESIKEFLINYRSIHNYNLFDSKIDSFILNDFTRDEISILELEFKYFIEYLGRFNFKIPDNKKQEINVIEYKTNTLLEAIDEFIIENYNKIKETLKRFK